jgi:hypothetical protein
LEQELEFELSNVTPGVLPHPVRADFDQNELANLLASFAEPDDCTSSAAAVGGFAICRNGPSVVGPTCPREGKCIEAALCSCDDGQRTVAAYECDGSTDCADGSDERDCD